MSPLTEVPVQSPGGFDVQYTDDALGQASKLADDVRTRLYNHMAMVAAVNPYLHGTIAQDFGTDDRRSLDFESLTISFWLSRHVKILTVVDIRDGGDRDKTPPFGTPLPPESRASSPFIGFGPDEDDDDANDIMSAGMLAAG